MNSGLLKPELIMDEQSLGVAELFTGLLSQVLVNNWNPVFNMWL